MGSENELTASFAFSSLLKKLSEIRYSELKRKIKKN